MIANLMALSVRARWAVVAFFLVVAAIGAWQLTRLPIDAVPDITNNQVQINTVERGLSPIEIEKRVTFPIETALAGIPGLETTRSISRNGFSQVSAIFTDKTDLYFARQQVSERIAQARDSLPDGVQPQIGPVTTGLGEVFMYAVDFANPGGKGAKVANGQPGWQSDGSFLTPDGDRLTDDVSRAAYLRTVQDWIIRPQLRTVSGVAGIDSIGGYEKTYVVEPDPVKLGNYGVSYSELAKALEAANLSVGANFFNRGGEAFLVRGDARIKDIDEIADAIIATRGGVPVAVKNVATVRIGGDLRTGAASMNGHEVVVGTALMLIGGNSRIVARSVGDKIADVTKSLPPGIKVTTTLDRSVLVNATVGTVQKNLAEGAVLVAAALFLLLGNVRAAIIAVLIIPFSFLMMAMGMNAFGVPGNLMSLGALDFGLIVDGAVIIIENCLRRLAERQHREGRLLALRERLEETMRASQEMIKPTVFGQAIIFLAFAPLLMFTGVEGKTFEPMALTVIMALLFAFLLSLTFVPAAIAVVLNRPVNEQEGRIVAAIRRAYEPRLDWAMRHRRATLGVAVAAFGLAGVGYSLLGQEFLPQLDEGNILVSASRVPGTSVEQSQKMQFQVERALTDMKEIKLVFSRTGTAELASDPMPPNATDTFVMLKPRREWPDPGESKAALVERVEKRLALLPGNSYEITQPIQMRFNELIAGVRSDLAVKVFGDNFVQMNDVADRIAAVLRKTRGAEDVKVEQTEGLPMLDIAFRRDAGAAAGVTARDVQDTVAAAVGGREAGIIFEGDRHFPIVIRLADAERSDLTLLGQVPVWSGSGSVVPLASVADIRIEDGLNQISRENGKRRVVVQANVRGRDVASVVAEAKASIAKEVPSPSGIYLEWGGQFENLASARARLLLIVPACFGMILLLLYGALGSIRDAAIVFTGVPLALVGGVFALLLRGMPFSISAAVASSPCPAWLC